MQAALVAGEQVLVMLLLMALGFGLYKLKILRDDACAQLNRFLLTVVVFAVMLSSYNREFDAELMRNIGVGLLFSASGYVIGAAIAYLVLRGRDEVSRAERFAAIVPNCGFMGIPLVSAFIGPEGVIYASSGIIVINIFQWTFGRVMLTGKFERQGALKKMLLNPGTLGCAAGLLLFCLPVTLPSPLATTVDYVASLNTPLAMIVIGTSVARSNVLPLLRSPRAYIVCAVKLLAIPLCALPLFMLVGAGETVAMSSFLVVACPCAAVSSLFPALLGMHEAEKRGAGLVTMSTVLSVLTIPLVVFIKELFI